MSIRDMGGMRFGPLSEEDRKRNEYLDHINHAPYFTIFLIAGGLFCLLTVAVLMGSF